MSLKRLGASITRVEFNLKHTSNELIELWSLAIAAESAIECKEYEKQGIDLSNDLPSELIQWNERYFKEKDRLNEYIAAKNEIKVEFDRLFKEFDLIISPVTCSLAPINSNDGNTLGPEYINGQKVDRLLGFATTSIVNYIGYPACSIPAGFGKHHLLIGLQMIGKYMDDETVLQAASHYEKINPYLK